MHQAESSSTWFAYGLVIRFRRYSPRLSTTQLPSTTDRPVSLSDGDFHPTVVRTLRHTDLAPTEPLLIRQPLD